MPRKRARFATNACKKFGEGIWLREDLLVFLHVFRLSESHTLSQHTIALMESKKYNIDLVNRLQKGERSPLGPCVVALAS